MFKIIGGDGRQYGPVTPEQLREWIAAGRANGQTMVQFDGETDWKPLSSFAEFADALASKPPSGQPPPLEPTLPENPPDPNSLASDALARDYELSVGSCLGRSWDLLVSDFWPIIGVSTLILILLGAANGAYVGLIINGPLIGGLFWYYLKKIRRQQAELGDAFAGFSIAFLQLFLGALVSSLLTSLGFAACIIPGVYLLVAWQLVLLIIIDRRIGFWDAMEISRKVLSKNWWGALLFILVCGLINIGGTLLCGIGLLVTVPLTMMALAFLYEDLFGSAHAPPA